MGKVGERVREYVALIKLMQPIAKLRLQILGGYAFIFLIILGTLSGHICFTYIATSVIVVLVVIALLIFYMLSEW